MRIMGSTERRQRERGQMHDAIIDAAVELFLSEGQEKVSIRGIAEKIEYTPGSIYSYFKDKDEIIFEIHKRGFGKLFEALHPALDSSDPLDKLYRIGKLYIAFALENRKYYDVMFINSRTAKTIQQEMPWECGHQAYELLRQIIVECIEQRLLPEGDADVASYLFWSQVHGMVSLILRGRSMLLPDQEEVMILSAYDYMWSAISKNK